MSWRLIAVIVLALIMGLVFGGLRVAAAADSAAGFGRVSQLANLGQQVTGLVQALEDERDQTTGVIPAASPRPRPRPSSPGTTRRTPRPAGSGCWPPASAAPSRPTSRPGWPPCFRSINHLGELRSTAQASQSALAVIADYSGPISDMLSLNAQIAQGTADSGLANDVQTLNSLSMAKDAGHPAARASSTTRLTQQLFADGELQALTTAESEQAADLAAFGTTATPAEQTSFRNTVAGPQVNGAELIEEYVISVGSLDTSAAGHQPAGGARAVVLGDVRHDRARCRPSSWGWPDPSSRAASRCSGARSGPRCSPPLLTALILLLVLIATALRRQVPGPAAAQAAGRRA